MKRSWSCKQIKSKRFYYSHVCSAVTCFPLWSDDNCAHEKSTRRDCRAALTKNQERQKHEKKLVSNLSICVNLKAALFFNLLFRNLKTEEKKKVVQLLAHSAACIQSYKFKFMFCAFTLAVIVFFFSLTALGEKCARKAHESRLWGSHDLAHWNKWAVDGRWG